MIFLPHHPPLIINNLFMPSCFKAAVACIFDPVLIFCFSVIRYKGISTKPKSFGEGGWLF